MQTSDSQDSAVKRMQKDLEAICDCGGRLCGTGSERAATALLKDLGHEALGAPARAERIDYAGWRCLEAELTVGNGIAQACHPLVRTAATAPEGLEAEVVDLGRGTPDEFAAHRAEIPGRVVLVRHELMFAPATIHRRVKYHMALEAGAIGFLISGPVAGSLVAGSSGRGEEDGIPALGIAPETAALLAKTSRGHARARLRIRTEEAPAWAENLLFELPGESDEWVVLSAHIDGHPLAESASDNASGLVVALEVARQVRAAARKYRRGLRLAFFNVEEWALTGSAKHVAALSEAERQAIALNVNLDSVVGGARLTALTSGFANLDPLLLGHSEKCGVPLGLYRPLQQNSDHANFAKVGIPAFRLVAGFGDPSAANAGVLTATDTRASIKPEELQRAARLTKSITEAALQASVEDAEAWRQL